MICVLYCNICLYVQNVNRLTLSVWSQSSEEKQEHCSCTTDWLASVLLVKLASWSQQSHMNIETLSLRLVDIESYSTTYERLKEKYGHHLISVSHYLNCSAHVNYVYFSIIAFFTL